MRILSVLVVLNTIGIADTFPITNDVGYAELSVVVPTYA